MKKRLKVVLSFLIFTLFLGIPQKVFVLKASINDLESIDEKFIEKSFYILGPGDLINIKFFGLPEISGDYQIMSDGNIQLPLIGAQNLSGYTLDGSINKLIELYKDQLINPQIDLSLSKPRPLKISMVGEVVRPGYYTLDRAEVSRVGGSSGEGTNIQGFPTVVDAIQKAGGLTLDADITNIAIYRNLPGNSSELKKADLDLLDLIKTGNQANNPILFDGDVIEIFKITDSAKSLENIPTNLTPEKINLYVVGEVAAPGMYQVSANTKISQAILIAGGPNSWRHENKVQLLRVNRNGSVQINKVPFNEKGFINNKSKLSLREGDIIKVNKNLFGKSSDALSTFLLPARDLYSLYGIYKLVND